MNFEHSDEDAIRIGEEIDVHKEDEKGKGKGKGKVKGKGKGKVKGKGKAKVGRPRKQREVGEVVEGGGSIDSEYEEVPKERFRGLSDIEEYDSDELPPRV